MSWSPSVVVDEIYIDRFAFAEAEYDAPVAADAHAPASLSHALERVQAVAWDIEIAGCDRSVEVGQDPADSRQEILWQSARPVGLVERTQRLVREPHVPIVTCSGTVYERRRDSGRLGYLGGAGVALVKRVQELHALLSQRRGVEHRTRLVLAQFQPRSDVARVVGPRRGRDAEIRAQERAGEFRDEFLARKLGCAGRTEVAMQTVLVAAGVNGLVR